MCISDRLPLCNKLPPNLLTYSNNMCYVTVLRICSAGSSNSGSDKRMIQVSWAVVISRLGRRRSQKWASCWWALVPCGLWAGGPKSCWVGASLSSLPCGSVHRAAHDSGACFVRASQGAESGNEGVSYSLILEGTSHHFCCILFLKIETLDLPHPAKVRDNIIDYILKTPGLPWWSSG